MTEPNDEAQNSAPPTFDSLPLSPAVRRAVRDLGFTTPTPVQRAVFEPAAEGLDLVVQARTGTGKTAAFGLPIIDRIVDADLEEPQVLILAPTRELALQISRELEALAKYKGVRCAAVYGGAAMQPQIDAIRRGAHIIAGTPGRVLDHLERRTLSPDTLQLLVLDESDEMLSMGFLPQITKIMERLPKPHQTLLFSATIPPDVKRIAETRLDHPKFITLSGDHVGALSIDHFIYRSRGAKSEELVQLVEVENPESAIVFCNTRDQTKRIAGALQRAGYAADWLNADLAQNDREKVMAATREGRLRFLVATDVAARGIDISHLTHVINADFPESTENYVHRTGRTGRAGRTGTAISLITPQDVGNLYMLRLTYKIFPLERELPSPRELQTRRETDLLGFLTEAFEDHARPDDLSLARRILESPSGELIVAGLLRDHLGAHPHAAGAAAQKRRDTDVPPPTDLTSKGQETEAQPVSRRSLAALRPSEDSATARQAAPGATSLREPQGEDSEEKRDKKRKKKDRKKEKRSDAPNSADLAAALAAEPDELRAEAQPTAQPRPSESRSAGSSRRENESRSAGSSRRERDRPEAASSPAGPALEVVSARDILGGNLEDLLDRADQPEQRSAARHSAERSSSPRERSQDSAEGRIRPRPAPAPSQPSSSDLTAEPNGTRREAPEPTNGGEPDEEGLTRIFVSVGRKEGLRARDLKTLLAEGGIHPDDIEFVSVKDKHSFVSVVDDLEDQVIRVLSGATFGENQIHAERARPRR